MMTTTTTTKTATMSYPHPHHPHHHHHHQHNYYLLVLLCPTLRGQGGSSTDAVARSIEARLPSQADDLLFRFAPERCEPGISRQADWEGATFCIKYRSWNHIHSQFVLVLCGFCCGLLPNRWVKNTLQQRLRSRQWTPHSWLQGWMRPESFCRMRFCNTSHAMEDIVNTIARIFDEAYASSQVPVALAKTVHSEPWLICCKFCWNWNRYLR